MKCLRLLVYWVCVGVDVSLDVLRYAKKYEGIMFLVVIGSFVLFWVLRLEESGRGGLFIALSGN